jgi:hypothetical protein
MIVDPRGKTEVNSRQPLVKNADGSVRLVFSPRKPDGVDRSHPRSPLSGVTDLLSLEWTQQRGH